MTYITTQPLKCTKCGWEHEASLHNAQGNIVFGSEIYCHNCISEFLRNNIGVMKCTVDFTGLGSEYDRQQSQTTKSCLVGREI